VQHLDKVVYGKDLAFLKTGWSVAGRWPGSSRPWTGHEPPLGSPFESWPPSLRTVVSLAQAFQLNRSHSPGGLTTSRSTTMVIGRSAAISIGVPWARIFAECWAAAVGRFIGEAYASACAGQDRLPGKHGGCSSTVMASSRKPGSPFSFSPITDESGKIAGLFQPGHRAHRPSHCRSGVPRRCVESGRRRGKVQEPPRKAFEASAHLFRRIESGFAFSFYST